MCSEVSNTELDPANDEHQKGEVRLRRLIWALIVVGFLGLAGACLIPKDSVLYPYRLIGDLVAVVAGLFAGTVGVAWRCFDKSFELLEQEHDKRRQEYWAAEAMRMKAEAFIATFPPSQEQVDEALKVAAQTVRVRKEGLALLYKESIKGLFEDLEVVTQNFKARFRQQDQELGQAADDFWRLWNLISAQGRYTLKKAWEPYAGLPWDDPERPPQQVTSTRIGDVQVGL